MSIPNSVYCNYCSKCSKCSKDNDKRERILKFQCRNLSERRIKQIFQHSHTTDNDLWIYAMTMFYISETDDNNDLVSLEEALMSYETNLVWCYQKGIDKDIEHIKELLGDRFLPYKEEENDNLEDIENLKNIDLTFTTFTMSSIFRHSKL